MKSLSSSLAEIQRRGQPAEQIYVHVVLAAAVDEVQQVAVERQLRRLNAHQVDPQFGHAPQVLLHQRGIIVPRLQPAGPEVILVHAGNVERPVIDAHRIPGTVAHVEVAAPHGHELLFRRPGRGQYAHVVFDAVDDDALMQEFGADVIGCRFGCRSHAELLPAMRLLRRQVECSCLGQQCLLLGVLHGHAHFQRLVNRAQIDSIRAQLDHLTRPICELLGARFAQECTGLQPAYQCADGRHCRWRLQRRGIIDAQAGKHGSRVGRGVVQQQPARGARRRRGVVDGFQQRYESPFLIPLEPATRGARDAAYQIARLRPRGGQQRVRRSARSVTGWLTGYTLYRGKSVSSVWSSAGAIGTRF